MSEVHFQGDNFNPVVNWAFASDWSPFPEGVNEIPNQLETAMEEHIEFLKSDCANSKNSMMRIVQLVSLVALCIVLSVALLFSMPVEAALVLTTCLTIYALIEIHRITAQVFSEQAQKKGQIMLFQKKFLWLRSSFTTQPDEEAPILGEER